MAPNPRMKWPLEVRRPAIVICTAVGLVVVAAIIMLPYNLGYYEFWHNFDPQGEDQLFEWAKVTAYMTATSGVYWGQLVSLLVGITLIHYVRKFFRTLILAMPAALLIALVNLAVAWPLSIQSQRQMALRGDRAREAGLPVIPHLIDDADFWGVVGAAVATFPLMAAAGVGLGALIGRPRGWFIAAAVSVSALIIATALGGFLASAKGDPTPGLLVMTLGLVPPSATVPSVVRTAVGVQGDTFTMALLTGSAGWAVTLVIVGWLAQRRRQRIAELSSQPE